MVIDGLATVNETEGMRWPWTAAWPTNCACAPRVTSRAASPASPCWSHATAPSWSRPSGRSEKGRVSIVSYTLSIPLALWFRWGSLTLFGAVAVLWLIPDRRLEVYLAQRRDEG